METKATSETRRETGEDRCDPAGKLVPTKLYLKQETRERLFTERGRTGRTLSDTVELALNKHFECQPV